MKSMPIIAALVVAAPAFANADATDPTVEVREALEKQADAPRTPPTLPEQASDRAAEVHQNIAFGKKGEAQRAAHSKGQEAAAEKGAERAAAARTQAAERAARGASNAVEKAAKAAEKAAAGMARSEEARGNRGAAGDVPSNAGGPRR